MAKVKPFIQLVFLLSAYSNRINAVSPRVASHQPDCDETNPYCVLNLAKGASEREIKSAYRTLARRYHPDKIEFSGLSLEEATSRFKTLTNARDKLISPPTLKADESSQNAQDETEEKSNEERVKEKFILSSFVIILGLAQYLHLSQINATTTQSEDLFLKVAAQDEEKDTLNKVLELFSFDEQKQIVIRGVKNGDIRFSALPDQLKEDNDIIFNAQNVFKQLWQKPSSLWRPYPTKSILKATRKEPKMLSKLFRAYPQVSQRKLAIESLKNHDLSLQMIPDPLCENRKVKFTSRYPNLNKIIETPLINSVALGLLMYAALNLNDTPKALPFSAFLLLSSLNYLALKLADVAINTAPNAPGPV